MPLFYAASYFTDCRDLMRRRISLDSYHVAAIRYALRRRRHAAPPLLSTLMPPPRAADDTPVTLDADYAAALILLAPRAILR